MKRESGIDLVRIMGLLCVVGIHQFLYNRFYYEPQVGFAMWAADCFRWFFFCCNGIFMTMTGYLRCNKKFHRSSYKSLVPILIGYVLCCCIIYPAMSMKDTEQPWYDWLTDLVNFSYYAWYIEMYIGLVLFGPVLNLGLQQLSDKELLNFTWIMVFVSSAHYITPLDIIPNHWSSLYPITYYVIGAAIRRHQPKTAFLPWMLFSALICMGLGAASILSTDEGFSSGFTQGYGGFWTMMTTIGIFLALYRIRLPEKAAKAVAWLSGGVFEGYLLSKAFDIWTYPLVRQWHKPETFWLVFLTITLPTFFATLLLGRLIHGMAVTIANKIPGYQDKNPASKAPVKKKKAHR